jgi:hypothetical protein
MRRLRTEKCFLPLACDVCDASSEAWEAVRVHVHVQDPRGMYAVGHTSSMSQNVSSISRVAFGRIENRDTGRARGRARR